MEEYILGQPYPDPSFRGVVDNAVLNISTWGFDLAIFWKNPTPAETKAVSSDPFTYGIFERDNVPFITLEFSKMTLDAPVNVFNSPPQNLQEFLKTDTNTLRLYFVDATSYIIKGLRAVGLNMDFVNTLKNLMSEQLKTYEASKAVDQKIHQTWSRYNTDQMIKEAKRFRIS
ncbi:hypothetical protein [Chitinophaga sp. YIM B06452]|uniref:hypothetical protein n=1 Tax=Chitinophaga sp. YIM B06452 TaxID=3082158 RepID=UPI0031FEA0E0